MTAKTNPASGFLKLGIIGYPLKHTLSPVFQNRLLQQSSLAGEYIPYEIMADALGAHLQSFAAQGGRGLNVTIPHKVAVAPFIDWLSPEAELMGAVNTLVFEPTNGASGKPIHLKGYNTDIIGFTRSLPQTFIQAMPQAHVLVLGVGGSARAVVAGLIQLGIRRLTLAARNADKAAALMAQTEPMKRFYQSGTEVSYCMMESISQLEEVQGIVNTTPVGMWPDVETSPLSLEILTTLAQKAPSGKTRFLYDLIYRPLETQLMQDAAQAGYATVNGLGMLIYQGIASFELWTFGRKNKTLPPETASDLETCLLTFLK